MARESCARRERSRVNAHIPEGLVLRAECVDWCVFLLLKFEAVDASFRWRGSPSVGHTPEALQLFSRADGGHSRRLLRCTRPSPCWFCTAIWTSDGARHVALVVVAEIIVWQAIISLPADDIPWDVCWACLRWCVLLVLEGNLWVVRRKDGLELR